MENRIRLVLGDWSHDGHGETETYIIDSNFTRDEIVEAYEKGTNQLGFDLVEHVAERYEDDTIPQDWLDKLQATGFALSRQEFLEECDDGDNIHIDIEVFLSIYLHIVQLGDSGFHYKIADMPTINIGGYGLFV